MQPSAYALTYTFPPVWRAGGMHRSGRDQLLEEHNDREVEQLAGHVARLKEITVTINQEINDQNRELDGMSGNFSDLGEFLNVSMRKVQQITQTGGGRTMCYLVAFAVTVFMVIYFLIR
eukprot:m.25484 g.25484  ORF g.25484 m.25484 type:complete len:119 (-) comp8726_c1_seq2:114-470(-)